MAMIEKDFETSKYKINLNTPYGKLNKSQEEIINKFLNRVTEVHQNKRYNDDEHLILTYDDDIYCFETYQRIYPVNFSEDCSTIKVINTGVGSNSIGYGNISRAIYNCYNQMSVDTFTIEQYLGNIILKAGTYKLPDYARASKEKLVEFLLDVTSDDNLVNRLEVVESFIIMSISGNVQYMNSAWETIVEKIASNSFIKDCNYLIQKVEEQKEYKHK